MNQIKEFCIIGLWGERNYHLKINNGKLIMVGENGCGKSTVLRIIYYTLAEKWGQLIKEDFERIRITIGTERKEFAKEQLGKPEKYLIDTDSEILSRLPLSFRRRYLDGPRNKIMAADVLEYLESERYPEGMFDVEIEQLEEIASRVPESIKKISEWLKRCLNQPVLYMPTYRRIEKDPEIQERELLGRRRYKRYSMCKLKKLKMEVSRIGMSDVDNAIHELISEIKSKYTRSSAQLNLDCFKGILTQDFQQVDSIPEEYMEAESIKMIFESLNEDELLDVDKTPIKEKLMAIIEKKEAYDEYDKIVKKRIEGGANEKAVLRLFINCPFVCINFDFFWLNKARQLYMDF